MHIFFSGISGTGIGPLAMIAKQAGHEVSGSDKQDSQYFQYLKKHGLTDIYIGQTTEAIDYTHRQKPIDWFVYSSAVPRENPDHPELRYVAERNIKSSKRDLLLNSIIKDKRLRLLGVAGTHGKTTTTAMLIWLLNNLEVPLSWSVGAKISFGDMGQYTPGSQYFALEADEFDRNFLSFSPYMAIITGVAYDHHEIYPTEEIYREAFREYIGKSAWKLLWQSDYDRLGYSEADASFVIVDDNAPELNQLTLTGSVNRRNAWLVIACVKKLFNHPVERLIEIMNKFPGVSRRMEEITDNLFTDYAHTTEKIAGAVQIAQEVASQRDRQLVVVYEPLTNRRMHHTIGQHRDLFAAVNQLYWVPSYLAREDPDLPILTPAELIAYLSPETQAKAAPAELDKQLKKTIKHHLKSGALVLCLSGGGGGSLDEWLRKQRWGWF